MSSKTLYRLVRFAVISTAVCALVIVLYIVPSWGQSVVEENPELGGWYLPWLIFAEAVSLPCFAILVLIWKFSGAIGREQVFTRHTAMLIKIGAILLFGDAGFFFAGNLILGFAGMHHPGFMLLALFGVIFVFALATLTAVLSRYVAKAAVLQEESEGII